MIVKEQNVSQCPAISDALKYLSKDGKLNVYPALNETKEKGKLKSLLKKLIHIQKGH